MYQVRLENFEGPLSLLLELIEKQKLDINQLSLARVADDYLEHIQTRSVDLASLSEFLLIASQLILIKSKALLPLFEFSVEEQEEICDLQQRLKEYQRFKEAAETLGVVWQKNMIFFGKTKEDAKPVFFCSTQD